MSQEQFKIVGLDPKKAKDYFLYCFNTNTESNVKEIMIHSIPWEQGNFYTVLPNNFENWSELYHFRTNILSKDKDENYEKSIIQNSILNLCQFIEYNFDQKYSFTLKDILFSSKYINCELFNINKSLFIKYGILEDQDIYYNLTFDPQELKSVLKHLYFQSPFILFSYIKNTQSIILKELTNNINFMAIGAYGFDGYIYWFKS